MLIASNILLKEKAANKWLSYTDRKMKLKLKNLLGIWFGLMFIEQNNLITFLVYTILVQYYKIEHGKRLNFVLAFTHSSPHHQSIHAFIFQLFISPSVHPSSIHHSYILEN